MATSEATVVEKAEERPTITEDYRPPYSWALGVALAIFALYVVTLAPTTAFWDTSEYIATAHILGVPHPPGNPVFVFLAHTWELLLSPLPVSTAVKINLFSAANSAAAAAFWFLVTHRILASFSDNEIYRRVGAAGAALISATAYTVWNQSVVNEKVYTVSLMTIALLTFLIFRWRDNLGKGKDDNLLVLIIFVLALSVGNHLMAFLAAPALGLFVIWVHPRVLARWRLYAFAAMAWVLGLSAQLFLPIRAAEDPVINEGDPTCESLVDATVDIVTFGKTNQCPALSSSLRREQYSKPPLNLNPIFYTPGARNNLPRDFHLTSWQFINYFQYFDWQWSRDVASSEHFLPRQRVPFTMLFLALGLFGAWRHFKRDRTSWVYFATLFATVCFGLVIYLNFKYGYSVDAHVEAASGAVDVPREWREVRERDYFFIVSFSQWGVWAGIGLAALWQRMAEGLRNTWLADRPPGQGRARDGALGPALRWASPLLVLAFIPLFLNWDRASRAGDYAARDWAYNLLMSVEPYGIVFTNGDNDTFPLWYLQEVEGLRRDVTVIVYSYLATDWYPAQLRDLTQPCGDRAPLSNPRVIICQRPFEPDKAIPTYRDRQWEPPSSPALDLSDAEIANVPDCYPVEPGTGRCAGMPDSVAVEIGDIVGVVPQGERLLRNDIFVLRILQSSAGDRPIYFASTTGTYEKLNVQRYMVRQGVGFELVNHPVQPDGDIMPLPAELRDAGQRQQPFWVDVPRTEALLGEHYTYRDLTEWDFWPDHSTNGIPLQYYQAYYSLASVYLLRGEGQRAEETYQRALDFLEVPYGEIERPAPRVNIQEGEAAPTNVPGEIPPETAGEGRE